MAVINNATYFPQVHGAAEKIRDESTHSSALSSAQTSLPKTDSSLPKFAETRSARARVHSQLQPDATKAEKKRGDSTPPGFEAYKSSILGQLESLATPVQGLPTTQPYLADASSMLNSLTAGITPVPIAPTPGWGESYKSSILDQFTAGLLPSQEAPAPTVTPSVSSGLPSGHSGANGLSPNMGTMALGALTALYISGRIFGGRH